MPSACATPLAIGQIGPKAVAYVADLDLLGSIAHCPGGILKENLLLHVAHQPKQITGLCHCPRGDSNDLLRFRC